MKKLLSYILLTSIILGANNTYCGAYSWSKEQATKVYQKAKRPMEALVKIGIPLSLACCVLCIGLEEKTANPDYLDFIDIFNRAFPFLLLTGYGYKSFTGEEIGEEEEHALHIAFLVSSNR